MKRMILAIAIVHAGLLAGCESFNEITGGTITEAGPVYPQGMGQSGMLDIQAFREDTVLILTNTTSDSFPQGGRFWVNAQFSLPFESFDIGETKRLELREFANEFGERFRAGGFFSSERPEDVVLVQIEHGGALEGLVVVKNISR